VCAASLLVVSTTAAVSVETPTEPSQPLQPSQTPVTGAETSKKTKKTSAKRGRDAAFVDPVVQELVRRYGCTRSSGATVATSVPGVPVMCTRSYRLRECKRRLV
jgi:hypothetical protein